MRNATFKQGSFKVLSLSSIRFKSSFFQSNLINTDTLGVMESVRINGVSILSGLNVGKMYGLSSLKDK